MATAPNTIDHNALARLAEAGAVHGADVIGQLGGWSVVIKYGMTERALAARRGAVRIFKKFETLVVYLKGLGISEYSVNAINFDPVAPQAARPDAADRMKRTYEAAAYDKWFRAQVDEAIKEADDPNTQWVSNEDVIKQSAAQRAKWSKLAEEQAMEGKTS